MKKKPILIIGPQGCGKSTKLQSYLTENAVLLDAKTFFSDCEKYVFGFSRICIDDCTISQLYYLLAVGTFTKMEIIAVCSKPTIGSFPRDIIKGFDFQIPEIKYIFSDGK